MKISKQTMDKFRDAVIAIKNSIWRDLVDQVFPVVWVVVLACFMILVFGGIFLADELPFPSDRVRFFFVVKHVVLGYIWWKVPRIIRYFKKNYEKR